MSQPPKVFVSYSHDNPSHKDWVRELAKYLRDNGIDAILDQWDVALGSNLVNFMEHGLSKSERVLIVLTDAYIEKANSGNGGVGYEKMIATAEILTGQDMAKFIPVVRNVTGNNKLPLFLGSRLYIDLSDKHDSPEQRVALLKEIHKVRGSKPPIGNNPFSLSTEVHQATTTDRSYGEEKPSLNGTNSPVFFADRFSSAFPGIRGIEWFNVPGNIEMRLVKLLEQPLNFKDGSPIWWWRDGNLYIHSFKSFGNDLYLMGCKEFKIKKIAAVNKGEYYQKFVYVETERMEPTGLYPGSEEQISSCVEQFGYCWEEYGLYKGEPMVTRAEYDDNAAVINNALVELGADVELRVRYITPYNFLIAAHESPINNSEFDRRLEDLLNAMLGEGESIDALSQEILKLPKKHW